MALNNTRTTHPKNSPIPVDWWGAADQCTMSHGTFIHNIIEKIPNYKIGIYFWNPPGNNNSIISSNTLSWTHQLLVCIYLLVKAYFSYLESSYNTWYVYDNKWNIKSTTKVVRRKHMSQLTGFGAYSLTWLYWDGYNVPYTYVYILGGYLNHMMSYFNYQILS